MSHATLVFEAERQYRQLVESLPAIVWRADARTLQFSFVSQQAETILGYPLRRWLDEPRFWPDHLHPEDHEAAVAYYLKATAELRAHDFEYRMIAADGSIVWLRDLVRVEAENGHARELVGVMVDITRQKQAEENLRDREELLRVTFDAAPIGVNMVDLKGRFMRTNRAYQDLVGYSEEELRGMETFDLNHPDDTPRNRALRAELLEGKRDLFEMEKRYCTKDGRCLWVRNRVSLVRDARGQPKCTVAAVQDITERRQAEDDLERKTALAQLLEALARAANEAATPGEAMQICLERICEHGNWVLGRLGMYGPGEGGFVPGHSGWYEKHPGRYAEFKAASLDDRNFSHAGRFLTAVLRENKPVWLDDIPRRATTGRHSIAAACGLGSAFAFPVSVRGNVVAFLEFYAEKPRSANSLLMDASTSVGAMLARLIERSQAAAEREQLAAIVESSTEAIWSRAADHTLLSWNAAAERLFGWTRDEVISKRDNFLVPAERLHERQLIPDRLARGEDTVTFETSRLRKDGTPIDVELRASAVRDDSGNVIWTAFIAHDITDRKRAEADRDRAFRAKAELAAIVENATVAIITRTVDGTILSWNPGAKKMLGYTAAEAIGKPIAFTIPPERLHRLQENNEAIQRGEIVARESTRITKDGRVIDVLTSHSPIQDGAGNIVGASIILQDITERKRAEEAMRESEQQMRLFMQATADCLWNWDLITGNVMRSIGFSRIFGYSEEEMDSSITWWEERLHPDDRERVFSAYQETVARGGHTCSYEYRFRRKNDTYAVINDHAYIVRDAEGKPVRALGAMTDITGRKAAEQALRDYSKRLQTLSRRLIDAQERERAVIARELHDQTGQVLSVLKLTLQIARRDARARQVAPHLDEALQHIDTALQQVRTLSYSLRPPQLDDLGLVAALRNYADRIAGAAGLKVHYDIQAPPRLAGQSAIACFRVAQEAITNVARHAAAKNLWIVLACDDELRLEVRDDGKGCDILEVRRRALRGDSMGVVNMEERTLLGGGKIDFDSSPGNGTMVRANFPFCIEESAHAAGETT